MDEIRVGIIGSGKVAQGRHIPRLKNVPGVEITHAWSRTPATARSAAEQFDIPNVVDRWEDIIESPEVDAVVIATPPVMHLPATLAALQSGKHVLCQARMARNVAEARRMLDASKATNLVTTLYPPLPGLKGDRVLKRLVHDEGYVGEVREVRVTAMNVPPPGAGAWATDPAAVGVNTMTLGILAEVINRWFGPASTVIADIRSHVTGSPQAVPDSLAIAAELESGATASYHLSSHAPFGPGSSVDIFGSKGAIHYKLFAEEISGATEGDDGLKPIDIPPGEEQTQTTDAEFIQAIREGTPVSPDFEEGLRYVEFCEAVAQSAHTGERVAMPPEAKMDAWGKPLDAGS